MSSKEIKAANERFEKLKGSNDFLINPISKIDSEIIIELTQILNKSGRDDVTEILKKYKFEKDETILDSLMQWNIDNPIGSEQNEEGDLPKKELAFLPPLIHIGDIVMKSFQLTCYRLIDELDENSGDYYYGIILNPIPDGYPIKSVPYFANEKVFFESEEKRNKVLENIKEFAKNNGTDFFDLNAVDDGE